MKNSLPYLLVFIFTNLLSQQKVFEHDALFSNALQKHSQSFSLSNQKNGDLFIITTQPKTTKGVLLDSLYNIKSNFEAEPLPTKFKIFTGYTIRQNKCAILFTNEKYSKLGLLEFDIKANSYTEKTLKFKFGKEKYLESIVYNNDVYFLTSSKGNLY